MRDGPFSTNSTSTGLLTRKGDGLRTENLKSRLSFFLFLFLGVFLFFARNPLLKEQPPKIFPIHVVVYIVYL